MCTLYSTVCVFSQYSWKVYVVTVWLGTRTVVFKVVLYSICKQKMHTYFKPQKEKIEIVNISRYHISV